MRLRLELAAPWIAASPEHGEAQAFVRTDLAVRIYTTSLSPRTDKKVANAVSALGWPVHIHDGTELRVDYELFELGGAAVASGPGVAAHRETLLVALLAGRPDWTGEVTHLADLFVP